MKKKNIYLLISILVFVFSLVFYIQNEQTKKSQYQAENILNQNLEITEENQNNQMLGGDKDEYGCIGSAGYSWCPAKNKCLRIWEEPCEENTSSNNQKETDLLQEKIVINGDKEVCIQKGGEWFENSKICEINTLNENQCLAKGGVFNECNSACRHDPNAEICTKQCVLTCSFK